MIKIDLDSLYQEYLDTNDIKNQWDFEQDLGDFEDILELLPEKYLGSFYEFTPEEIIENILRHYEVLDLIEEYNFNEEELRITPKDPEKYYKFGALMADLELKNFACIIKYD